MDATRLEVSCLLGQITLALDSSSNISAHSPSPVGQEGAVLKLTWGWETGKRAKHHVRPKIADVASWDIDGEPTRFIAALARRCSKLAGSGRGYRHNYKGATLLGTRRHPVESGRSKDWPRGEPAWSSSRINMPSHISSLALNLAHSSIPYCTEIVATRQTVTIRIISSLCYLV
jgi:hypothetical protein